ncbi:hypothetical protein YH69_11690 [Pseudomonas aeruginosa]|nr:hypothetical protein YH69_11690 [Pseudomonas aeruginosa]
MLPGIPHTPPAPRSTTGLIATPRRSAPGRQPKPRSSAATPLSSGSLACLVALPFPTASRLEPARPAS